MKTIGCIIARTKSRRLPKKVLKEINGKNLIEYIIEKMKYVKNLDEIYLCTSIDKNDKILLDIAERNDIKGYAGSRKSVINRMLDVAKIENADNVVRITGDNVFTDEIFLERMIKEQNKDIVMDYTKTEYLPIGVTAEVIKVSALNRCYEMMNPYKSQYLMLYMFDPDNFHCQVLVPPAPLRREFFSLTVDTQADLERTKFLIDRLYKNGRIYYDGIIKLSENLEVPHFRIDKNSPVKMPDNNKNITYGEFRKNMKDRIDKSKKVLLEDNFYEKSKK